MPWRRERLPTPVFWPGEFHGLYSPWGCKESDTTERLSLSFSLLLAKSTFGRTSGKCMTRGLGFQAHAHLLSSWFAAEGQGGSCVMRSVVCELLGQAGCGGVGSRRVSGNELASTQREVWWEGARKAMSRWKTPGMEWLRMAEPVAPGWEISEWWVLTHCDLNFNVSLKGVRLKFSASDKGPNFLFF